MSTKIVLYFSTDEFQYKHGHVSGQYVHSDGVWHTNLINASVITPSLLTRGNSVRVGRFRGKLTITNNCKWPKKDIGVEAWKNIGAHENKMTIYSKGKATNRSKSSPSFANGYVTFEDKNAQNANNAQRLSQVFMILWLNKVGINTTNANTPTSQIEYLNISADSSVTIKSLGLPMNNKNYWEDIFNIHLLQENEYIKLKSNNYENKTLANDINRLVKVEIETHSVSKKHKDYYYDSTFNVTFMNEDLLDEIIDHVRTLAREKIAKLHPHISHLLIKILNFSTYEGPNTKNKNVPETFVYTAKQIKKLLET